MKKVGIIAEYNPFHNGHIYHLQKVKEMFPDAAIILVLSSHFTQRGIPSILSKWDKTWISLQYGVDLVIELPFAFATQSADFFAQGAIEILKAASVNTLVFGSESDNIQNLWKLADIELHDKQFNNMVQNFLKSGMNYPTALNASLKEICGEEITTPNDLLGLSYIKEIMRQKAPIQVLAIQRTNSYHERELSEEISSATSIRNAFLQKRNIEKAVPPETIQLLEKQSFLLEDYFPFLKYQIYASSNLADFLDVDEGIENRIVKEIDGATSFEDLILKTKTKRYTYNKMNRMYIHILCGFTKKEREIYNHVSYLRILGFSKVGQEVLKELRDSCPLPIYTQFQNIPEMQLEKRITSIYASILTEEEKIKLIQMEYQNKPIRKEDPYV